MTRFLQDTHTHMSLAARQYGAAREACLRAFSSPPRICPEARQSRCHVPDLLHQVWPVLLGPAEDILQHRVHGGQLQGVCKRIASSVSWRRSSLAGSRAGSLAREGAAQVLGLHGGALCSRPLLLEQIWRAVRRASTAA